MVKNTMETLSQKVEAILDNQGFFRIPGDIVRPPCRLRKFIETIKMETQ